MLVSEIASRVKRQFGDEVGAQITDADILRWCNDGQRELATSNDILQTTAKTGTIAGEDHYTLPDNILQLRSIRVGGRKLQMLTAEQAAEWTPNIANGAKGVPTHFSQWAMRFDLYPTPDYTAAGDIEIFYTRIPAPLNALSETPEVPQQYHNRLVEYCIAQAYELDDDHEASERKMRQFREGTQGLNNLDNLGTDAYSSISVSSRDTDLASVWWYE